MIRKAKKKKRIAGAKITGDITIRRVVNTPCPSACGMKTLLTDGKIVWCSFVHCRYWRYVNET